MTDTFDDNFGAHIRLSEPVKTTRQKPAIPGESFRLHDTLHNFKSLIPYYGREFVGRFMDACAVTYLNATATTAVQRITHMRRFLNFVATQAMAGSDAELRATFSSMQLGSAGAITKDQLSHTAARYADAARDLEDFSTCGTQNLLTRQCLIETASAALRDLAYELGWPVIEPLKGMGLTNLAKGTNTPSLGELERPGAPMPTEMKEVARLSKDRLSRLRSAAEIILLEEERKFDRGQKLLSNRTPSVSDIEKCKISRDHFSKDPKLIDPLTLRCFPQKGLGSLAALLKYIVVKQGGLPSAITLPDGLKLVAAHYGGYEAVTDYLEGSMRALMAAYTLILVDTGINIQPCDDLAYEQFAEKARRGNFVAQMIDSRKRRAANKPITTAITGLVSINIDDPNDVLLPVSASTGRLSSVEAIRIWQKLSAPMRRRARQSDEDCSEFLWIVRHGHTNTVVRRYQHAAWSIEWDKLLWELESDDILGGLSFNRRSIRQTWIQLQSWKRGGSADFVAILAGHSSPQVTNKHYLSTRSIHQLLDSKIRDFQNLIEAVVVGGNADWRSALGLSDRDAEELSKRGVNSGLGLFCSDPYAGVQKTPSGAMCHHVDRCADCSMMRFVPSKNAISQLLLLRMSLETAQTEFFAKNKERWVKVWLPLLALTIAILEKLSAGPKKQIVVGLMEDLKRQLQANEVVEFRPW